MTLKDTPVERTYYPGGVTRREYDTDGFVWQAEEVRKGDQWERFYGFVGHHVIARAPAAEIEFRPQWDSGWNLTGGAHFEPGNGSRLLAPLESFEVMRLDLNDWFDLTKPGRYRAGVNFAADCGLGEGSASHVDFQIGGDE